MTPPKILCISLGSIGKRHLRNARTLLPDAKIGVWRQHTQEITLPEGADTLFSSLKEAQAFKPDAVIISSPASEHMANAAAFPGVPLFIEKPLAVTAEAAKAFSPGRGFIMVGYVLRFLPVLHAIKKIIADGTLGDIYTARIEVGQYLPDWRPEADYRKGVSAQAKLGGGAVLELSHEIDYATWLFGWPDALQCSRAHLSPLDIDVEDSAHLLLEYPERRVAVQLDFLQRVAHMEVQLVGEKGNLKADLIKEELTLITPEFPQGTAYPCEKLPNGNDIYLRQFDFFFTRALADYKAHYTSTAGFKDWASVEQALGVLQLVDAAKKASDSGTRQTLPRLKTKAA